MRKIILVCVLCISVLQMHSQCTDCHDGTNPHHTGNVTPDGNSTLGVIFDSTLCGLNYIQALVNTQTRYTNSRGTGFPTHDTVKGLPPCTGDYTVLKAYLYFQASCPNPPSSYTITDTVTNPLSGTFVYTPIIAGTGIAVCWGENSTALFRADITTAIAGNGPYRVNMSGFGADSKWIDGASIVIIYKDLTASYTGTFVLSDGEDAIDGGTVTYTATGFNACAAAPAFAFMDFGDIQNNVLPATFTTTENGTTGGPYPANFFQSAGVGTNVTLGQTSATYTMTRTSDCFSYFLSGLYFQTACLTCTPIGGPITYTTQQTPAPCGKDSGTAKITITSDTSGLVYHWSTGSTADSIFGLAPGTYTATITGPGGCHIDTVSITIVGTTAISANIAYSRDSVCSGISDTLTLSGSGGNTYLWSPGGATNSTIHINLTSTKTYTLYTFVGGCTDSAKVNLKIIPKITDTITAVHDTVCPHDSSTLTITAAGGQSTYKWSTGATTSSITVADTVTTTYTATAYGICDSAPKTIKVVVIPLPKPVITGTSWKCKGVKDTLFVSSSVNPTTYVWSNGSTKSSIVTGPINADSTIYVTAENSLGCIMRDTFKILLRTPPTVNITPPASACAGQPVILNAVATGNNGPFTYTWLPNGTGTSSSVTVTPDSATTYIVTVSNGCKSTKAVTVTPESPAFTACCTKTIVKGDDTTLVASGNPNIQSYTWAPPVDCLDPPLCDMVKVSPAFTTTYTVTGTDANGCQSENIITIIVETPCFNFVVPNVFTPSNAGTLGLDNVFYINTASTNINSWSLIIFDRWGKEMYNSTNPTAYWDGSSKGGEKAPDGVYYYVIDATCQGTTYKKEGFVQLIR